MSTHVRRHPNTSSPDRSIPVTREALARVEAEAVRLDASLAAARAEARRTGVMGDHNAPTVLAAGELHLVLSRLRALQEILAAARVVESDGVAALGSRVTVRDAAGELEDYILVAPGLVEMAHAEPPVSRVSCESPVGSALLGRRAGDEVDVAAPDAIVRVRLVHVE